MFERPLLVIESCEGIWPGWGRGGPVLFSGVVAGPDGREAFASNAEPSCDVQHQFLDRVSVGQGARGGLLLGDAFQRLKQSRTMPSRAVVYAAKLIGNARAFGFGSLRLQWHHSDGGSPLRLILLLLVVGWCGASRAGDTTFAPLWLYQGAWHVTRGDAKPGAKPDELVNQCALVGKYFTCQQTVNGKTGNLLVFVAAGKPGDYYTQNITPEGRATGRANLQISGDQWTYSSTWDQGGKTIYYRTTNKFTGKDKIHFEQAESDDGKDYKVTGTGDELRAVGGGRR